MIWDASLLNCRVIVKSNLSVNGIQIEKKKKERESKKKHQKTYPNFEKHVLWKVIYENIEIESISVRWVLVKKSWALAFVDDTTN